MTHGLADDRPRATGGVLCCPQRTRRRVNAGVGEEKSALSTSVLPGRIAYDGNRFNRTAATAPLFNYLAPSESADEKMVSQTFASWNQLEGWLRAMDSLRRVA